MNEYYVTFRSLTAAQNASNALRYFGIDAPIVNTPAALSPEGCSYSVSIAKRDIKAVKQIFRQKMIPYRQILAGKNNDAGEGNV